MYNTDLPTREDLPSSAQLLRSTLIALGVAAGLLVTVILPAEYGIDPTRLGRALGLTQMGEIKMQLAEDAARDAEIDRQAMAAVAPIAKARDDEGALSEHERPEPSSMAADSTDSATSPVATEWTDIVSLTLAPGEAAEIKLFMKQGEIADYEWSVPSGHLNSDLHGDGSAGQSASYRKGRAETGDAGQLTASFDGSHGWFWRNRSNGDVDLILRVKGQYSEIKRVI